VDASRPWLQLRPVERTGTSLPGRLLADVSRRLARARPLRGPRRARGADPMGRPPGIRQRKQQMARLGPDRAQAGIGGGLRRSALGFIAIFLLCWLLTAAVYRQTASNFLRAESGWFLFLSHSDPGLQRRFEKVLLTRNLWGHYAPLVFVAEFETAKLAGTHGA